jgi:hypothetical protein
MIMKNIFTPLLMVTAFLTSCTTAYKSGQTPDDVYFSPEKMVTETTKENDEVQEDRSSMWEEQQIRMRINNARWRNLDYSFSYNPYQLGTNDMYNYHAFTTNYYYYNPYNNYVLGYNYGSFYNPYYTHGQSILNCSTPITVATNSTPRFTNLSGYGNNNNYSNNNAANNNTVKYGGIKPVRTYNNSNNSTKVGSTIRRMYNNGNNNSSNTRTYTPSSNSSTTTPSSSTNSGSSSSSSSSGTVTRPARGGGM